MLNNEIIKRAVTTTVLVLTGSRQRDTQIKQLFQKAGFKTVDSFRGGVEQAKESHPYDFYFIEYTYKEHPTIAALVDGARQKLKFGARPIFILDILNEDTKVDKINARELQPDFIVDGLINFDYLNGLIKKGISVQLLIEKLVAAKGKTSENFLKYIKSTKGPVKNRMELNIALEELMRLGDKKSFVILFRANDQAEILPQNLMSYCSILGPHPQTVPILEQMISNQKFEFRANQMLAACYARSRRSPQLQRYLKSAFENNPTNDASYHGYINYIIETKNFTLLQSAILKRFFYTKVTPESLSAMFVFLAERIEKFCPGITRTDYNTALEPIVKTLKKRISIDRRDEVQGIVNLMIARHLIKRGRYVKAKALAANCYMKNIRGRGGSTLELRLIAMNVMSALGEIKLAGNLHKSVDFPNVHKKLPHMLQQIKETSAHYQRMMKTNQWLDATKAAEQKLKVRASYPASSAILYQILIALFQHPELRKSYLLVKNVVRLSKRLKRCNYDVLDKEAMEYVQANYKSLSAMLKK